MKPSELFASLITVLAALRFCIETYVDTEEGNEAYVAEVHRAIDHLQQLFESTGILTGSFSSLLAVAPETLSALGTVVDGIGAFEKILVCAGMIRMQTGLL